jgi:hypothetical protein
MTKHFLVSTAAAALIVGTGFAYAQGTGMSQGAGGGSAASQSAPSTSGAVDRNVPSPSSDMQAKPTDSYEKSPHENRGARSDMDHDRSNSMRSQSSDPSKSEKNMRSEDRNRKDEDRNQRAEDRDGKSKDRDRNSAERSGKDSDSSKSAGDSNRKSTTTTGQASAGAKLSTEQRSKITTVIRNEKVQPVTNVNFSIAVGTRVPRTVNFYPLPMAIVDIYPAWSGYQFFLVRNEIVVVDPHTLEIVAVLDA